MDADWSWFDHRQHGGLKGLDDDCLGLQGSCCMSQGHSCNQRFGLDGNFRARLNWPLDWLSLFGWGVCVRGWGWKKEGKTIKQDLCKGKTDCKVRTFAFTVGGCF